MTHLPKTAALEAYAAALLSEGSTLHLERHLQDCDVCKRELASIRAYHQLRNEVRVSTPQVNWEKMEFSLAREARTQVRATKAKASRPIRLVVGASALAAAAAGLLWLRSEPQGPSATGLETHVTQVAEAPRPMRRAMRTVISLQVGSASRDGAQVQLDDELQGGTFETGEGSQLHASLLAATEERAQPLGSLVLAASSSLTLVAPEQSELDDHIVRLERGRATVESFRAESRIVVLASAHRVVIEAARCTIDFTEGRLAVVAAGLEGHVFVDGAPIAIDHEGARFYLSEGASSAITPETFQGSVEGPVLAVNRADIVRFEVDGISLLGGPSLAMHVSPDDHHVRAFDASGHVYEANVVVGADGASLSPDDLAPRRVRVEGFLSPEEITPVVRASQHALQRCYEQALRLQPELGGARVVARVALDADGEVRRVHLDNQNVPASVEACITHEAAQWHFPAPGGPMSFELPLRFATTTGR